MKEVEERQRLIFCQTKQSRQNDAHRPSSTTGHGEASDSHNTAYHQADLYKKKNSRKLQTARPKPDLISGALHSLAIEIFLPLLWAISTKDVTRGLPATCSGSSRQTTKLSMWYISNTRVHSEFLEEIWQLSALILLKSILTLGLALCNVFRSNWEISETPQRADAIRSTFFQPKLF